MARVQTMVQLNAELLGQLDREATRRSCSRSAIIREAVVEHLAAVGVAERVQRYVEGYRRIPQGATDEWGEVAADLRQARHDIARRLDAEEDAAGLSW